MKRITTNPPEWPKRHFQFVGRYKDIVGVRGKHKHYYRRLGNMNKKRFYTDPAFKASELASREFGAAAKLSATIRKAMEKPAKELGELKLHSRFTKAIQHTFRRSQGKRGQRILQMGENLRPLEDFLFKKDRITLEKYGMYTVSQQPMHQQSIIQFAFHNWGLQKLPTYANHMRVNLHLVALSDLKLAKKDSKKWHYVPSSEYHGQTITHHGPWLPFRDRTVPPIHLQQSWNPHQLMPEAAAAGCTILAAISIEICEYHPETGKEQYHKQIALKIVFARGREKSIWEERLEATQHPNTYTGQSHPNRNAEPSSPNSTAIPEKHLAVQQTQLANPRQGP
jgi:hypothetical protein